MKFQIALFTVFTVLIGAFAGTKNVQNLAELASQAAPETNRTTATNPELASIDLKSYEEKYKGFPAVYLKYVHTLEHVVKFGLISDSWKFNQIRECRYLVLDSENESITTFRFTPTPGEAVKNIRLWITRPGGERELLTDSLTPTPTSNGLPTYKYAYPNAEKGSIIFEQIETIIKKPAEYPPIYHELPLQFDIPCEKIEVYYAYPDWWKIRIKETGPGHALPYKTLDKPEYKTKILAYFAENLEAVVEEPYSPFYKEMANHLVLSIVDLEMGKFYHKAPDSWVAIGLAYKELDRIKGQKPGDKVHKMAKKLTKDLTTKVEKLAAINRFVQKEIELVEDGDYEKKLTKALSSRKGDHITKLYLAKRMAEALDLRADILLIHSAEDGYFDPKFFDSRQFQILGLSVTIDEEVYVVFPYLENLPFNHVPEWIQGQDALFVSRYGTKLGKLPKGNMAKNMVEETYELEISEDGLTQVKEQKTLHGSYAYMVREELRALQGDDRDKVLEDLMTYNEGAPDLQSKQIHNLDDFTKPLIIDLTYNIDNLVTVTPDEVLFDTDGLFSPVSLKKYKVESETRRNPIMIPFDISAAKEIKIKYPSNWSLTTVLKSDAIKNDFGSIERQIKNEDSQLEVAQTLNLKKNTGPKEQFPELLKIAGGHANMEIPTLIFAVKERLENQ